MKQATRMLIRFSRSGTYETVMGTLNLRQHRDRDQITYMSPLEGKPHLSFTMVIGRKQN